MGSIISIIHGEVGHINTQMLLLNYGTAQVQNYLSSSDKLLQDTTPFGSFSVLSMRIIQKSLVYYPDLKVILNIISDIHWLIYKFIYGSENTQYIYT